MIKNNMDPDSAMWKDSVGDLHSRLKTRKILGVGETDNGDIHRSKISQVLGHNEHLYVRLPRGFWTTHVVIGIGVTLEALLLLLTPTFASSIGLFPPPVLEEGDASHSSVALRLAGAALAGLSVFVWSVLGTTDKHYARTVLLACITYHVINMCLAGSVVIFQGGLGENRIGAGVGLRTIICLLCLIYFQQIGEPGSGLKKCSSFKDISNTASSSSWDQANKASYTNSPSKGIARSLSSSCFVKDYPKAMNINTTENQGSAQSKKEN